MCILLAEAAFVTRTAPHAGSIHPLVDALADQIRESWSSLPGLAPLPIAPDLEAISGSLDGEKLFIRNELKQCRGLRKLHLETARLGAGLQILHCVFFPDPRFDLPVFGADIVAGPAGVSAAIADLSPTGATLPAGIVTGLEALPVHPFSQPRELPAWGTIFSPFVRFVRPVTPAEEGWFIEEVKGLLAVLGKAVIEGSEQPPDHAASLNRYHGQLSYCQQQKRNDKTRRVLEKAFNPTWANRYIEELLFDDPSPPPSLGPGGSVAG
ncbi:phycocyanobilin:ferredoxin oxidoreductase [Synechococcus sp. CS-602]|nr:phycocyanobilin:ferredoxin oxidoreductase [Synechococcus sp. SynAce01]MCT0202224.1 phycocyanobilin:ferredoxin oxidoreductase [Synechococcus sp. CS-603]MCT0205156.1 phycocyanobilin:ferredoxin oxidoreductase [Synechococcus sp. CS-602]MCT0245743.1 phycocyanobilin:ferredoxin oxidoreductase [Synechococcus sp. CS-601]